MHILKQKDRIYSSKVNFFNENEDSFHNEKNLQKEIEDYKWISIFYNFHIIFCPKKYN